MDKVEMSLDEIIKLNKGFNRGGRRGRGSRGGGGATRVNSRGGVAPIRNRRGLNNSGGFNRTQRSSFTRSPGDINGRWTHDMYDGPVFARKRGAISGGLSGGPTKLEVSNLDYGVSDSDIQELFTEFGPLKKATVNYDKSGRSMGTALVIFERRGDAVKALKQYNGVPLDGRPMKIELVTSDVGVVFQQSPRLSRGFNRSRTGPTGGGRGAGRGGGFRRGGRGGSRGGRPAKTVLTAAELDADLDNYINKIK